MTMLYPGFMTMLYHGFMTMLYPGFICCFVFQCGAGQTAGQGDPPRAADRRSSQNTRQLHQRSHKLLQGQQESRALAASQTRILEKHWQLMI